VEVGLGCFAYMGQLVEVEAAVEEVVVDLVLAYW
jgi:hypothetical protein